MKSGRQTTLGDRTTISGTGVHSGFPVTLTLHPGNASTGGSLFVAGSMANENARSEPVPGR